MKLYIKEKDGKIIVRPENKIDVVLTHTSTEEITLIDEEGKEYTEQVERKHREHIQNPTHEQILADGWSVYNQKNLADNDERSMSLILRITKESVLKKIDAHDTSSAVNEFYYGDMSFWLPRETRVSVRSTAQILKDSGHQTMTLWLGDVNVTLAPEEVLQMLAVLEVYALECYNTTAKHKANVNALTDIKEVKAYDFTTNYPEKIHF